MDREIRLGKQEQIGSEEKHIGQFYVAINGLFYIVTMLRTKSRSRIVVKVCIAWFLFYATTLVTRLVG